MIDHCFTPLLPLRCVPAHSAMQRAKKQREEVGVEMYGYQQSLAKLQMTLGHAQEGCASLSNGRLQVSAMPWRHVNKCWRTSSHWTITVAARRAAWIFPKHPTYGYRRNRSWHV